MHRRYFVYIVSNLHRSVLYTGVTNDLERRMYEHKHNISDSFTKKYNCHYLVYFEETNDIQTALSREKEIKGWKQSKKDQLIRQFNPDLKDLSKDWEWKILYSC